MRTKLISTLKKDLLIIEFPEGYELAGVANGVIYYYDNQMNYEDYPLSISVEGSYALLGKPDEIKEEDAMELVEQSIHSGLFAHYVKGIPVNTYCYKTALDSFNSALESEIYWDVNPLGEKHNPNQYSVEDDSAKFYHQDLAEREEAQEKTFDKKRTLIFAKL